MSVAAVVIPFDAFRGFLGNDAKPDSGAADEGAKGLHFFLTEVLEANGLEAGPQAVEMVKAFFGELGAKLPGFKAHEGDPAGAGELLREALEALRHLLPAGVRVVVSLAVHAVDAGGAAGDVNAQPEAQAVTAAKAA